MAYIAHHLSTNILYCVFSLFNLAAKIGKLNYISQISLQSWLRILISSCRLEGLATVGRLPFGHYAF